MQPSGDHLGLGLESFVLGSLSLPLQGDLQTGRDPGCPCFPGLPVMMHLHHQRAPEDFSPELCAVSLFSQSWRSDWSSRLHQSAGTRPRGCCREHLTITASPSTGFPIVPIQNCRNKWTQPIFLVRTPGYKKAQLTACPQPQEECGAFTETLGLLSQPQRGHLGPLRATPCP